MSNIWDDRRDLGKFLFVGVLNTIVGYGSFYILAGFIHYMLALIASHIIGVAHSYAWNRRWVFKSDKSKAGEFLRFNAVYLLVLAGNSAALYTAVDILGSDARIAQLFILPAMTAISFFGHRGWSFAKEKKA